MNILVTGGCGFLGSHFVRAWLRSNPDSIVSNADCLTYAGSTENLEDVADDSRHHLCQIDIADAAAAEGLWDTPPEMVVHFAAETHVDRSLEDAGRFVRTNVLGMQILLDGLLRRCPHVPLIIISSDEVYGPTPKGQVFGTGEPLRPTSPYAASKAAGDLMALAYAMSFGLDVTIIRSVNVYGPRQYPEKFIPLFIARALAGKSMPLYGNGRQRRCWLYVDDLVDGVMRVIGDSDKRRERPVWHLGSLDEVDNRSLAQSICAHCGVPPSLITAVTDRPGHDRRYALDYSQTSRVFAWQPRTKIETGLRRTVEWIRANQEWCRRRSGWAPQFLRGE